MAERFRRKAVNIPDDNIHKGHRERLKRRFRMGGIKGFDDHNILELLLFWAIPLRDTNPLAHKLVSKFCSLNGVLDAPVEALEQVEGIGESAATFLSLVGKVASVYASRMPGLMIDRRYDYDRTGAYILGIMKELEREQVFVMYYDHRMECIGEMMIHAGNINGASFLHRRLAESISLYGAEYVVVAHNHPEGIQIASGDDLDTHKLLKEFLSGIRTGLIEHYVIAPTGYSGIEHRLKQKELEEEQKRAEAEAKAKKQQEAEKQ